MSSPLGLSVLFEAMQATERGIMESDEIEEMAEEIVNDPDPDEADVDYVTDDEEEFSPEEAERIERFIDSVPDEPTNEQVEFAMESYIQELYHIY